MSDLRDQVEGFIKRVKELQDLVRGNEQATKSSLIGPFFTMLGYDLADPRECIPEYKADFGPQRSTKPMDWAFKSNGTFIFFVEAKEVGKRLAQFDEQLADYFAKDPNVKLGILTNGVQWKFYTDVEHGNVMDKQPFAVWDILSDEPIPIDAIRLLQKSQFNPELIRTYAQRKREQNLLVGELSRLLEPASEFTKLAISKIETRYLTQPVVDSWKPVVSSALNEWARQRMLSEALSVPSQAGQDGKSEPSKVETTQQELDAFELIKRILGPDCPIAYEDSVAYFKVHLAEKRTWVFVRLQIDRKVPNLWVPLSPEQTATFVKDRQVTVQSGWSVVAIDSVTAISDLADLVRAAYANVKQGEEQILRKNRKRSARKPSRRG